MMAATLVQHPSEALGATSATQRGLAAATPVDAEAVASANAVSPSKAVEGAAAEPFWQKKDAAEATALEGVAASPFGQKETVEFLLSFPDVAAASDAVEIADWRADSCGDDSRRKDCRELASAENGAKGAGKKGSEPGPRKC